MSSKDEVHQLRYALWDDIYLTEKPYIIMSYMPHLKPSEQTNIKFWEAPKELIKDVRGNESSFSLDGNGFRFVNHEFPAFNPADRAAIENTMYPLFENMLKCSVDGVDQVHFFDHRIRTNESFPESSFAEIPDLTQPIPPARGVHIDQSPGGALKRVRAWMGDETDYLLKGRVRIINIWFPYDYPVEDCPLALCDGSSTDDESMLVADHITRTYIGETVYPMYNSSSKWYYLSDQKRSEVLLFKMFDSDESVPARRVPHTAFELNSRTEGARPRKSIEIRALVFTYPTDAV